MSELVGGKPIPVDSSNAEEEQVSRRTFMRVATGGMCLAYAAAIGYPVYRYLNSPVEQSQLLASIKEVTLDGAQTLPENGVMVFKFGPFPAMLIHHQGNDWVAFNSVCSHLGCTVQYHPELNLIKCACHGGEYDPHTGQNIAGPPPKPLTKYAVKVGQKSVTVTRA